MSVNASGNRVSPEVEKMARKKRLTIRFTTLSELLQRIVYSVDCGKVWCSDDCTICGQYTTAERFYARLFQYAGRDASTWKLVDCIPEDGFLIPICLDTTTPLWKMYNGHHRVLAAILVGYDGLIPYVEYRNYRNDSSICPRVTCLYSKDSSYTRHGEWGIDIPDKWVDEITEELGPILESWHYHDTLGGLSNGCS